MWKNIIDYEGLYLISNQGDVMSCERFDSIGRRVRARVLKASISKNGYKKVVLYKNDGGKSFNIHSLVASTFLTKPLMKCRIEIDHLDGNKLNNVVSNLQYVSGRENTCRGKRSDGNREKSSSFRGVSWHKVKKKWTSSIRVDTKLIYLGSFDCELKARDAYIIALTKLDETIGCLQTG